VADYYIGCVQCWYILLLYVFIVLLVARFLYVGHRVHNLSLKCRLNKFLVVPLFTDAHAETDTWCSQRLNPLFIFINYSMKITRVGALTRDMLDLQHPYRTKTCYHRTLKYNIICVTKGVITYRPKVELKTDIYLGFSSSPRPLGRLFWRRGGMRGPVKEHLSYYVLCVW
jgi:hypothetical protein